jgi:hypothetical protein
MKKALLLALLLSGCSGSVRLVCDTHARVEWATVCMKVKHRPTECADASQNLFCRWETEVK